MTDFADIAHPFQNGCDLRAYARGGFDRVLIKATEGTGYTNPLFGIWWDLAGKLGLARGAYHFARPSEAALRASGVLRELRAVENSPMGHGYRSWVAMGSPRLSADLSRDYASTLPIARQAEAEAEHFLAAVRAAGGFGPRDWACLDTEDTGTTGVANAGPHAQAFTDRMVTRGVTRGLVYTGVWYAGPGRLYASDLAPGWRHLHLADYTPTPDVSEALPARWTRDQVVARQFTDAATTAGIAAPCDRSRVIREWLTTTEDDVTPQDKTDIANAVLDLLKTQVFGVTPTIRQPTPGAVVGATYNKVGDVQTRLTDIQARLTAIEAALLPSDQPPVSD